MLYLELLFSCKRCEYNTKLAANGNMCQCGRVVTLWTPKTPAPWASSPTTSTSAPLAEDEFSMQGYQNVQNQGVIAMANALKVTHTFKSWGGASGEDFKSEMYTVCNCSVHLRLRDGTNPQQEIGKIH